MNKPFAPVMPTTGEAPAPPLFGADEFDRMIALGAFSQMRVELVGGVIERIAPAHLDHGARNLSFGAKLLAALADRSVIVATDLAARIDDLTIRAIDIAVARTSAPRQSAVPAQNILLAVEIAETTIGCDLGEKAADYARGGIPAYWVVDGRARVIHVFGDPAEAGYRSAQIVRFGEALAVPGTDTSITLD